MPCKRPVSARCYVLKANIGISPGFRFDALDGAHPESWPIHRRLRRNRYTTGIFCADNFLNPGVCSGSGSSLSASGNRVCLELAERSLRNAPLSQSIRTLLPVSRQPIASSGNFRNVQIRT